MFLTDGVTDTAQIMLSIKTVFALIAQSVEHAAVNRGVTGSSPVWGASKKNHPFGWFFLFTLNLIFNSDTVFRLLTGLRVCARSAR